MSRRRRGHPIFLEVGGEPWPAPFSDGDLNVTGVTTLLSGSTKQYRDITIGASGELRIVNSLATSNGGNVPTIIGCRNLTITAGGKITANQNAMASGVGIVQDYTYSNTPPTGAVVTPISYTIGLGEGGNGGSDGSGAYYGADSGGWGHGGGGGGNTTGSASTDDVGWGVSGTGGQDSANAYSAPGLSAYYSGFSQAGYWGEFAAEPDGLFEVRGGGASGGTRGYNGGCFYIQVTGTITVAGVCFEAKGAAGGTGGSGGDAGDGTANFAFGGGGAGGGAGGNGGRIVIRYKTAGSAISSANCDVTGGSGGPGGGGGLWLAAIISGADGVAGSDGALGINGTVSIAAY